MAPQSAALQESSSSIATSWTGTCRCARRQADWKWERRAERLPSRRLEALPVLPKCKSTLGRGSPTYFNVISCRSYPEERLPKAGRRAPRLPRRLWRDLDVPRAGIGILRLLRGLLQDFDLHRIFSFKTSNRRSDSCSAHLPLVVHLDINEPGAQRAFTLSFVLLHTSSVVAARLNAGVACNLMRHPQLANASPRSAAASRAMARTPASIAAL